MAYYTDKVPGIGTQSAQPASGSVTMTASNAGPFLWRLHFVFSAARISVTDAAASGSSGSLKLFDFREGVIVHVASRHNFTAFAEGTALTTAAGDAAFVIGFGSVAADAGDGALSGTEVDFGAATGTVTLSSGAGTSATKNTVTAAAVDGTATAVDLYINWSGSAATIDANSTIDVTGTYTVLVAFMGDD